MNLDGNNYYFSSDYLIGSYNIKRLLFLLKDRKFILNYNTIRNINNEFPFETRLNLENGNYKLKLNIRDDIRIVTSDYEYI